jgi:cytochrome c-type biogenesis protein CcmH
LSGSLIAQPQSDIKPPASQIETASAGNASDRLLFTDPQQRQRYYQLIAELRCPKCQNQNLADSDAPIASDLRNELHLLISEGYSDAEILEFMQSRYGDFVLYSPPVNSATAVLWLLPAGLAAIGALIVIVLVFRNRQGLEAQKTSQLAGKDSEDQQQKMDDLIDNIIQNNRSESSSENNKYDN